MSRGAFGILAALMATLVMSASGCGAPASGGILYHNEDGVRSVQANGTGASRLTDFGWWGEYSPGNSKVAFGKPYSAGI